MIRELSALMLLAAAYAYWRQAQTDTADGQGGATLVDSIASSAGSVIDNIEGATAFMNLSSMRGIDAAILYNANVQAFLRVIRTGEGTADAGGYKRLFGGGTFASFADHPRKTVTASGYRSTAAGAYQFLASTWDETARAMGLSDFSPRNQDLAAVGRIAARRALDDVVNGRFASAIRKCAWEWASLPGSPYGQPTMTLQRAADIYAANGGFNEQVIA